MGNPVGLFSNYWGPKTLAQGFATGSLAVRRDAFTILNTLQAGLEIRGWKRDRLYLMIAAYHRALTFQQMPTVQKLGFAIAHELQQRARHLDKILAPLLFPARTRVNRFDDFNPADLERLTVKETRIEIGAQDSGHVALRQKAKKVSRPVLMAAPTTVANARWVAEQLTKLQTAQEDAKKQIADELRQADGTELIAKASSDNTALTAVIKLARVDHVEAKAWVKRRIVEGDERTSGAIVEMCRELPGLGFFLVKLVQEGAPAALLLIARAAEESPLLISIIHAYFLTTRDGATLVAIKEMVRGLKAERAIEEARKWLAAGEPLLDGPEHPFLTLQTWAKLGNPAAVQEIISLAIAGNPGARFCLKQLASEGTDRRVIDAVHDIVRSGDPKTVGEFAEALTDMVVYAWDEIALKALARAASRDIDAAEGLCKALAQLNPSPLRNRGLRLLRGLDVQTIAERALTEAEAVITLHSLAEFGHDDARVALRNLDVNQLAAGLGGEIIGNKPLRIIKALRWATQTGGNRRAAEVLRNYDVSKLELLAKGDIAEYGDTVDALEDLVNVGHRGAERALESLKRSGDPETRAMAASALRSWRDRMSKQ